MIRLQGNAVSLTSFAERHLSDPKYHGWLHDPTVMRFIGRDEYLKPVPLAEIRDYVERLWKSPGCTFMAIHHAANDEFIGTVKLNFIDASGQRRGIADVGIMIGDRTYWGKGLASDVLYTASKYAFSKLAARKLTAGAISPNESVIRAFKRIGYVEEGRLRDQLIVGDTSLDHVLLGCFEHELRHPTQIAG